MSQLLNVQKKIIRKKSTKEGITHLTLQHLQVLIVEESQKVWKVLILQIFEITFAIFICFWECRNLFTGKYGSFFLECLKFQVKCWTLIMHYFVFASKKEENKEKWVFMEFINRIQWKLIRYFIVLELVIKSRLSKNTWTVLEYCSRLIPWKCESFNYFQVEVTVRLGKRLVHFRFCLQNDEKFNLLLPRHSPLLNRITWY